jgi:hypothetical protein
MPITKFTILSIKVTRVENFPMLDETKRLRNFLMYHMKAGAEVKEQGPSEAIPKKPLF